MNNTNVGLLYLMQIYNLVGNVTKSDYLMRICKLSEQTYKLTFLKAVSLIAFFIASNAPSYAMDLSSQSDLVDSGLSASLLGHTANRSLISQIGNHNKVTVNQNGNNLAIITEVGNFNIVNIQQDGVGNSAVVTQIGNGNDIEVIQKGSFNNAIATQEGGAGYKIEQIGDNMNVVVTQFVY